MNSFETADGDWLFSGDDINGGRIVLLSDGRALAFASPRVDIAEMRKGRRKVRLPDEVLMAVRAMVIGKAADNAAKRAHDPAESIQESQQQFQNARILEEAATKAREDVLILTNGPVTAARSAYHFREWFMSQVAANMTQELMHGLRVAEKSAARALMSETAKRLLKGMQELTSRHGRLPMRSELQEFMGIDGREKSRDFRRLLKAMGFDWLPQGRAGRPRGR